MSAPLLLHADDTVAILTEPASAGAVPLGEGVALARPVARGHKIARRDHAEGAAIVKFGQVIGYATRPIAAGEHVHSHNCAIGAHDRDYRVGADLAAARAAVPAAAERTFMGYRRTNGQTGTRNYIALVATVNCSATVIRKAAERVAGDDTGGRRRAPRAGGLRGRGARRADVKGVGPLMMAAGEHERVARATQDASQRCIG